MPLYRVGFSRLVPQTRYVFFEDELDELDTEEIVQEAWFKLREYLDANGEEAADWDDPEVEVVQ